MRWSVHRDDGAAADLAGRELRVGVGSLRERVPLDLDAQRARLRQRMTSRRSAMVAPMGMYTSHSSASCPHPIGTVPPPAPTMPMMPNVAPAPRARRMVESRPTKSKTACAPAPPVSSRRRCAADSSETTVSWAPTWVGEVEAVGRDVDRDDASSAEEAQVLHRVAAEAAGADHHGGGAGHQLRQRLLDRVVRRRTRVGERCRDHWVEGGERDELPGRHDEVLGEPAVLAVATTGRPARGSSCRGRAGRGRTRRTSAPRRRRPRPRPRSRSRRRRVRRRTRRSRGRA